MKFNRSRYLLQSYRELQRRLTEFLEPDLNRKSSILPNELLAPKPNIQLIELRPPEDLQKTGESSLLEQTTESTVYTRSPSLNPVIFETIQTKRTKRSGTSNLHNKDKSLIRLPRTLTHIVYRQLRQPFQGDDAYAKYMFRIKQKYQKYVKSILGYHDNANTTSNGSHIHVTDSMVAPTLPTNYVRNNKPDNNVNSIPISLPIQSNTNRYSEPTIRKQPQKQCSFSNNTYCIESNKNEGRKKYLKVVQLDERGHSMKPNISELIAKLKSQFVRRRRSVKSEDGTGRNKRKNNRRPNLNYTSFQADEDDKDGGTDGLKRGKPKGPCEVNGYFE